MNTPDDSSTPEDFWTTTPHGWSIGNIALDGDGLPSLVEMVHEDGRALRLVPQDVAARAVATMAGDSMGRMLGSLAAEVILGMKEKSVEGARARGRSAMQSLVLDVARQHGEALKDAEAVQRVKSRPGRGARRD